MQILNFKDITGKPNTVAEFDVYVPEREITFNMMKLIRTKKGALMVSFPCRCEKTDDGKYIFHPYVTLAKRKHDEFQKEVLELVKAFLPSECPF